MHDNTPGSLKKLNDLFAFHDLNIVTQHLQTDGEIGYVVVDIEGQVAESVAILEKIRAIPGTIRARLLNRV